MFFKVILGLILIIILVSIYFFQRREKVPVFNLYDSPLQDGPISRYISRKDIPLVFCGKSGEIKNFWGEDSKEQNLTSGLFCLGKDIYYIDTLDEINKDLVIGDIIVVRDKDSGYFFYDRITFLEIDPEEDDLVYYLEKNNDYPVSKGSILGKLYYKKLN